MRTERLTHVHVFFCTLFNKIMLCPYILKLLVCFVKKCIFYKKNYIFLYLKTGAVKWNKSIWSHAATRLLLKKMSYIFFIYCYGISPLVFSP